MKNNDTTLCENAVDGTTSLKNDVIDGIQKDRYEELYDYYLQFGFDALKRDFNLEISREVFIRNCIKYVDKCPYNGRRKENLQICRNMYQEYVKNGFKGVVEKFNYRHDKSTLLKRFSKLLPEYDANNRIRKIKSDKVKYYTKIYEYCKLNGYVDLKEKFGCSANPKFLRKQFAKYVKNYKPIKCAYSEANNRNVENGIESQETHVSVFWRDFDFENASLTDMTNYILSHSDYGKIDKDQCGMHYLVYMVVNKINGKIYIGQHQTNIVDDGYMGSGTVLELAKAKYGLENFEKYVLFDFDSFDDMNSMEIDIVCKEFIKRVDCVYNRCNGGFDGPNSEFQKEMHRTGQWKSPNEGKVVCHDADGNEKYFFDGEIPDGWVKGGLVDVELHKKLDELMDELHSLGSNYRWKTGDSIQWIQNMIEQFKKRRDKEENNKKLWKDIFEYYKEHGRTKTVIKYKNVDGIMNIEDGFEKYFKEELIKFREYQKNCEQFKRDEFERIKAELISYGFDRVWETYNYKTIKKMYDACMRRKAWIDNKIKFYTNIIDECYKYGISYVGRKYHDTHIGEQFSRFVPLLYKKMMLEKYNKHVEVNENVYSTLAYAKMPNRKKREFSKDVVERIERNKNERLRLYNELVALGSDIQFRDNLPLTVLRNSIERAKITKEKKDKMIKYYNDFYKSIMKYGYKESCKMNNYTGTLNNLKKRFTTYVPQFNYGDF